MIKLLPYQRFTYYSQQSEEELVSQLKEVLEYTKSRNCFNALTNEDLYVGKIEGSHFSIVRKKFMRGSANSLLIRGTIVDQGNKRAVQVKIGPDKLLLAANGLFTFVICFFLFLFSGVFWLPLGFVLICYLIHILSFNYELGWATDFLERWIKTGRTRGQLGADLLSGRQPHASSQG